MTLKPVSRQVVIGEYQDAWSISPDSRLAFSLSASGVRGRIGVRVVDLATMTVVEEVETGIAAVAVAWLAPRRLVASLQRGGTVLIDPDTGRILRRWKTLSFPDAAVRTDDAVVKVFTAPPGRAATGLRAARLAVVDASGRLRRTALKRLRVAADGSERAGLAVDRGRGRAYVVAAGGRGVAEVDLTTMAASYNLELPGPSVEQESLLRGRQRRALWLGGDKFAVYGRDLRAAGVDALVATPAGVRLIDTSDWSVCTLDEHATGAAFAAGTLLTYGPGLPVSRNDPGSGLRGYALGGGELFHILEDRQVWDVQAASAHVYVQTPKATHVVDARTGRVVAIIASSAELADVIARSS